VNSSFGSRATIIHDQSHTTRDITRHIVEWEGRTAYLQDTPGFGNTKDTLTQAAQDQLAASLKTADVIVVVVDSTQSHITESEKKLARTIRSLNKPTFLLLNKSDKLPTDISHFKALGIENTLHVSAHHGEGIEEIKTLAANSLPKPPGQTHLVPHRTMAMLGRPPVGKSRHQ
jgi:small GTP-binding protein